MQSTKRLATATLAAALAGCNGNMLYFVTYTKLGVSASGTGNQVTEATLGYDRFEGGFLPVRDGNGDLLEKVPSVYACIDVDNRWFDAVEIDQVFATGAAADKAAGEAEKYCPKVRKEAEAKPGKETEP